ncbi:hypothetical protein HG530_007369 [Fusarium avenaceum]|nr:hypothetical protein HG530_007369 [Fusarium avenaceum]
MARPLSSNNPITVIVIRVALDKILLIIKGHLYKPTNPSLLCWIKAGLVVLILVQRRLRELRLSRVSTLTISSRSSATWPSASPSHCCYRRRRCSSSTSSCAAASTRCTPRWAMMSTARRLLRCVRGCGRNGSAAVSSLVVDEPDNERSFTGYLDALTLAAEMSIVILGVDFTLIVAVIRLDNFRQKLNIIKGRWRVCCWAAAAYEPQANVVAIATLKLPQSHVTGRDLAAGKLIVVLVRVHGIEPRGA